MSDTDIRLGTITSPLRTKADMRLAIVRAFHMSCTRLHRDNRNEQAILSIPIDFFKRGE